jgi:hypothetical protein
MNKEENDYYYDNLNAPNSPGYQFCQARGLIVIDSPTVGNVAVLPVGMRQVSSVIITDRIKQKAKEKAEVRRYLIFSLVDLTLSSYSKRRAKLKYLLTKVNIIAWANKLQLFRLLNNHKIRTCNLFTLNYHKFYIIFTILDHFTHVCVI